MKKIKLTQNKYALVDDRDFDFLNQWNWYARKTPNSWYVQRMYKRKVIIMHRVLLSPKGDFLKKSVQVDHKNMNGLDNRRSNIRICTKTENDRNRPKQKNNTSGYKGVRASGSKFLARIRVNKKLLYLGTFKTAKLAAKTYNKAAVLCFGEFAYLNKI